MSPLPPSSEPLTTQIAALVEAALPGATVRVADDSAKHAGHAGVLERGGGHYRLTVVWAGFTSMARLARHRQVQAAVAELMAAGKIHALQLQTLTPEENQG